MRPEIKILAISNVYCRLMNFKKAGDQELGHFHDYDHGTLLASGKLLVEKLDDNDNVTYRKEFVAPTFIFIEKNSKHLLTSLEDNTVATCIHALRTVEEDLVSPEFIVEETEFCDTMDEGRAKGIKDVGTFMFERGLFYKSLMRETKE